MDYDLVNRSADSGFLYFWGIECFDELVSEGVNVGEFGEGLRVAVDLGFSVLLLRQPVGELLNLIVERDDSLLKSLTVRLAFV